MSDHLMPRDNLVRAVFPASLELRDTDTNAGMPTLTGEFAVFDTWTEINSSFEGRFMERIAPSAFDKTFKENRAGMRVLFNHGNDPSIGDKVLGPIENLEATSTGARYDVPLFDTSYNRDLIPGLKANVYGASFRFKVMREDIVQSPERSDQNPNGLPERTITEARVMEFGPVTFPAYDGASAGIRSLTDEYQRGELVREVVDAPEESEPVVESEPTTEPEPETEEASSVTGTDVQTRETEPVPAQVLTAAANTTSTGSNVTVTIAAPSHPESSAPGHPAPAPTTTKTEEKMAGITEMLERIDEIGRELEDIANDNRGNLLDPDTKTQWDALRDERKDLDARVTETRDREDYIRSIKDEAPRRETADGQFVNVTRPQRDKAPDNVYSLEEYHGRASSQEQLMRLYTDGAKRAIEGADFPDPNTDENKAKTHMERALNKDTGDKELARRILTVGSPTYRRAFGKYLNGMQMTPDETRALGIASQGGQMPVPIQIDPTVTLTSNGVINPLRQIANVKTISGYEWRGVVTSGVTAAYAAEGAVTSDNSPTLVQPTIDVERVQCFVPFSIEVGQDWAGIEGELGGAIADAKDVLEATAFLTGAGHASSLPRGVLRSCATVIGTALNTNAGTVFTVQHPYELETALPPRFRGNASFVMNKAVVQRIRQFDTAGGAGLWTGFNPAPLQAPMPSQLLGYPVYELSTMSTAIPSATGASWALFGDFSQFVIADRIGMSIELIPQLFSGNTAGGIAYPTGQRGLFAFWRNSSDVLTSNAFRAGTQS